MSRVRGRDTKPELFVSWIGARQAAQREQPRHEPDISLRLARADELRHLVEAGEVVPRLGRGGAVCQDATVWQLDRPGQIAEGHEPAAGSRRAAHRSRIRTTFLRA